MLAITHSAFSHDQLLVAAVCCAASLVLLSRCVVRVVACCCALGCVAACCAVSPVAVLRCVASCCAVVFWVAFSGPVWCRCLLCRALGPCPSPWGVVPSGTVFCRASLCFVLCVVRVLPRCVGACCCSPLCFVPCVSWGVVLCVVLFHLDISYFFAMKRPSTSPLAPSSTGEDTPRFSMALRDFSGATSLKDERVGHYLAVWARSCPLA